MISLYGTSYCILSLSGKCYTPLPCTHTHMQTHTHTHTYAHIEKFLLVREMLAPILHHKHTHACTCCSITHPHTHDMSGTECSAFQEKYSYDKVNERILVMLRRVLSEFNQLFLLGRQPWY